MSYQDAGRPLLLHMRHQRHEKAGAHGTRLITAALVPIVGAVSPAAATLPSKQSADVHGTQARQAAWKFDR